MSRYFAIQSWVSSHDNEPDYSGQQTGSRDVRSVEIPMFTQHGRANVDWFSDEAIAARTAKKAPTVSIKDKILPQFKRLNVLQAQMMELEQSYKAGEMDIHDYSVLRDIVVAKIQRQEVLLKRAQSIKPTQPDEDDSDLYCELPEDEVVFYAANDDSPAIHTSTTPAWLEGISDDNSCKKAIIKACVWMRKAVQLSQATKRYIKTLQEA